MRRVVSRHLKARTRRRSGGHGHYSRKPTNDEVVPVRTLALTLTLTATLALALALALI